MIFSYGTGRSALRTFGSRPGQLPVGATMKQAINAVRAELGCGQNVEGRIGGVPQADDLPLSEEMGEVKIYDIACSKAA